MSKHILFQAVKGRRAALTQHLPFLLFNLLFITFFSGILLQVVRTSWNSDYFSYVPFIPFLAAYLLYQKRHVVFSAEKHSRIPGMMLTAAATLFYFWAKNRTVLPDYRNDYLTLVTFSLVTLWISAFTAFYGTASLRKAGPAPWFLYFAVPIPGSVLDQCILFLQRGSADAAGMFFSAAGIPFVKDGFVFHLPTVDIEVAKQCSGIRSVLSLVITTVMAGAIFLRTAWARSLLVLLAVPIAILKNGFRIFALALLGIYVDEKILTHSTLHSRGGILFFLLALILVGAAVLLLRKTERTIAPADDKNSKPEPPNLN